MRVADLNPLLGIVLTRRGLCSLLALFSGASAVAEPAAVASQAQTPPIPLRPARLSEGDVAPNFRLRELNGRMVRLDELAYAGRQKTYAKKAPVFLDFFRTDCVPCLQQLPELTPSLQRIQQQGAHILIVAVLEEENGRAKLDAYLHKNPVPFRVVVDSTGYFAEQYIGNPMTLPASFVLNKNGRIAFTHYGTQPSLGLLIEENMQQLLRKKPCTTQKTRKSCR